MSVVRVKDTPAESNEDKEDDSVCGRTLTSLTLKLKFWAKIREKSSWWLSITVAFSETVKQTSAFFFQYSTRSIRDSAAVQDGEQGECEAVHDPGGLWQRERRRSRPVSGRRRGRRKWAPSSGGGGDSEIAKADLISSRYISGRLAAKIARKDSLALKLALRPDRQELIDRNILQVQSEKERLESKEAVGARLIRRLSMRPTAEELVDRNILKTQTPAEEKKSKEEKKRMLLRKLSFRPTVEELKEKKVRSVAGEGKKFFAFKYGAFKA